MEECSPWHFCKRSSWKVLQRHHEGQVDRWTCHHFVSTLCARFAQDFHFPGHLWFFMFSNNLKIDLSIFCQDIHVPSKAGLCRHVCVLLSEGTHHVFTIKLKRFSVHNSGNPLFHGFFAVDSEEATVTFLSNIILTLHLLVQSRIRTLRRQRLARQKSPILTAQTTRPLRSFENYAPAPPEYLTCCGISHLLEYLTCI